LGAAAVRKIARTIPEIRSIIEARGRAMRKLVLAMSVKIIDSSCTTRRFIFAGFRQAVRLNFAMKGRSFRYGFILAHMRSGSSLLSHILGSHPEIASAIETHTDYRTPVDLAELPIVICRRLRRLDLDTTYAIDQINHYYVDPSVLPHVDKVVILFREPSRTLPSIMERMSRWTEETAVEYYVKRLAALCDYRQQLHNPPLCLEYEDLTQRTGETLAALARHFELSAPLQPSYRTTAVTQRFGDNSQNIVSGKIIATKPRTIAISTTALARCQAAYERCREQLRPLSHFAQLARWV
jgi:hypothetical protein